MLILVSFSKSKQIYFVDLSKTMKKIKLCFCSKFIFKKLKKNKAIIQTFKKFEKLLNKQKMKILIKNI